MALVAGALLDSAEESHASPRPHGLDELRRSTLQLDPPPRCCG
jgi:hypothetical protein